MKNKNFTKGCMALVSAALLTTGCSDSFLEQDPLSFYNPENTYTTESGLQSALAMCDYGLKEMLMDGNNNVLPMASLYFMTDIGLYAKTDVGEMQDDFANKITPTSGMKGGGDENAMSRFWDRTWNSVTFANTIISYIDRVPGLDPDLRDEYLGRAYFHRAYAYYHGVLLFGDIPLITKLIEVPKQNYKSTSKQAIFEKITEDLEFAVEHVSPQREIGYIGTVNQEACKQLLIKCYLVLGRYQEAEQLATDLINNHGLALMTAPFGTNVPSGNPETWAIQRNVLWDLHRGVNVTSPENTEMIMPILNYYTEGFISYPQMRAMCVHWSNGIIIDPHNVGSPCFNYARNAAEYDPTMDYVRALGRGIGCFRTSYHYNQTIWNYGGETDWQDLRHNRQVGNWVEMTDLKYNKPESDFYGQNLMLYAPEDWGWNEEKNEPIVKKGQLLCSDTIRSWYPTPLYKVYILDQAAEENQGSNSFVGATNGNATSNGNMYLFRLAETYLLRAEAKFYQGNAAGAAEDVNVIRRRANAKKMFTTVTIGDICDERARELYLEEWRQPELTRISWCLARSGQPDEWGETYDLATWDKQSGTDLNGGSYWYKRTTRYNIFNHGPINSGKELNYRVDKRNLFWPVPNSAITANTGAQLRQNYGYDGYDPNVPMFENWQDAVADEETAE